PLLVSPPTAERKSYWIAVARSSSFGTGVTLVPPLVALSSATEESLRQRDSPYAGGGWPKASSKSRIPSVHTSQAAVMGNGPGLPVSARTSETPSRRLSSIDPPLPSETPPFSVPPLIARASGGVKGIVGPWMSQSSFGASEDTRPVCEENVAKLEKSTILTVDPSGETKTVDIRRSRTRSEADDRHSRADASCLPQKRRT
ncbi:unnamed protein product, partial [Ectocarpus sp. 12 AP-2014]